jgi:hypothetical protein
MDWWDLNPPPCPPPCYKGITNWRLFQIFLIPKGHHNLLVRMSPAIQIKVLSVYPINASLSRAFLYPAPFWIMVNLWAYGWDLPPFD